MAQEKRERPVPETAVVALAINGVAARLQLRGGLQLVVQTDGAVRVTLDAYLIENAALFMAAISDNCHTWEQWSTLGGNKDTEKGCEP